MFLEMKKVLNEMQRQVSRSRWFLKVSKHQWGLKANRINSKDADAQEDTLLNKRNSLGIRD